MFDSLLQIIAPHYCYQCRKVGRPLCANCKYDIICEPFAGCIVCGKPTLNGSLCTTCRKWYSKAWCVGERSDTLQNLIDSYKFQSVRAIGSVLASLLDDVVPELPSSTIVVPIPTVRSHVRQRGYDHAALIARGFARRRGLRVEHLLRRTTTTTQRGASRNQRLAQARQAFGRVSCLSANNPYLLVDDVMTTGATLHYAAKTLYKAGARDIWVAVVARQPIDM